MIEATEKKIDAIGIEGKQAVRPAEKKYNHQYLMIYITNYLIDLEYMKKTKPLPMAEKQSQSTSTREEG